MNYYKTAMITLFTTILNLSQIVHADESEIYFAVTDTSGFKPNVFFILDVSGSMDEDSIGDDTAGTKIENLRHALYTILDSEDIKKTNVGIMTFSNSPDQKNALVDLPSI